MPKRRTVTLGRFSATYQSNSTRVMLAVLAVDTGKESYQTCPLILESVDPQSPIRFAMIWCNIA